MQEGIVYNLNRLRLIRLEVQDIDDNFLYKRIYCKFGVHVCLLGLSTVFVHMFYPDVAQDRHVKIQAVFSLCSLTFAFYLWRPCY